MFSQTPAFIDVCRYFAYPVQQSGTQFNVTIPTANGTQNGYINLQPQTYFMATALRCTTNYDNTGGVFASAVSTAILARPFTPNNFTVLINRGNYNKYSNQPMAQAEICSSGYRAGKVFPLPVIYGPRSNLTFEFHDTTGFYLLTAGNAAIPLTIDMFLEGYRIPIDAFDKFLNYFPHLADLLQS